MQNTEKFTHVPEVDENYVAWGNAEKVERIISSRTFYPTWITGPSGNGKTTTIEQACAKLGRSFVRVNFTNETGEDDLIGSLSLVEKNGVTVTHFNEGPVVQALREGAILLLDEVDVGNTNRILCLQSVLEGKGVLIKSTGEFVKPKRGFNVFATSNTQGRGSDDGRYIGTNIMNAAFLDRFSSMLHQSYADEKIESQMLTTYFISFIEGNQEWTDKFSKLSETKKQAEIADIKEWCSKLCLWAKQIRQLYTDGQTEEVITTRSLISILQAYAIFLDKESAVEMACNRFSPEEGQSFIDLYNKLNNTSFVPEEQEAPEAATDDDDFITF